MDERGEPVAVINSRDVTERRAVERQLRESERRFRLLFEKNAAGMVITDADHQIWQANAAFCRLLGYSEEELLQKTLGELSHPEDRVETVSVSNGTSSPPHAVVVEKRYIRKDGETVWVNASSISITAEHSGSRDITTVQDITPRKRALEALRVSEQRSRSLLQASAEILWIADAQGNLFSSPSWCALTGTAEEENSGSNWQKAIHPEDRERAARHWARAVEQKTLYEEEVRIRTASGEYRDFAVRGAPIWDDSGTVREWVGSCTDITDQKRAAANVLTWKNRYDAAIRASRQMLYDWDMKSDHVIYGGNPEAILGYTLQEMTVSGGVKRWLQLIHPDDREYFQQGLAQVLRTHEPFHREYRLRQKDGSYRMVQDDGQCYLDERGNAFRMTGFVADITERTKMEQRLRASEERFRRIFEECGVGMAVLDLELRFLQINPAYCHFLGYTEEELRTMTERELVYGEDLPLFDRGLEEVLSGKKRILDLEKRCIRKDGRVVWARLTGVFPAVNGRPAYCVAVVQDISRRKQAEQELQRRDRFYRSLIENSSDNITVLSDKGITLFQSPAIYRQLGYRPEELVGHNNAELIHPQDRPKATKRLLETLRRGETVAPQHLRFRTKDGSWRILETVGKRFVGDEGKVVGIFNTRDVTERVIAGELLQRAKQQAEAANLAKDRFLASLSHELRTPLTPVVALLPTLVQTPEIPEHVRADLQMIKQNVDLETRLIDDLLDLTRITQGKVHLNRQNVDAHELIQCAVAIVRSDAEAKQVRIQLDLPAAEHHIWGDRVRLQQVPQIAPV
ncbi:MAG: PAS domain S-box protein, partial [Verrucomicrobiaceae bacterium]